MSDRDRLIAPGRTEVAHVRFTEVKLEKVGGESDRVRDEAHAKANHYIKQSRPFFPRKKLPTYIHCPYLLQFARVLFVASLSGGLAAAGVSTYIAGSSLLFVCCSFTCTSNTSGSTMSLFVLFANSLYLKIKKLATISTSGQSQNLTVSLLRIMKLALASSTRRYLKKRLNFRPSTKQR